MITDLFPREHLTTAMAIYGLCATLGSLFAEVFFTGASGRGIGLGMATLIAISCPIGSVLLALGFRAMREAVDQADRWTS